MKKNNKKENDLEEFRKRLEVTSEKDFDGRTSFHDLSVREKLIWLSELNFLNILWRSKVCVLGN
jgi:hypothetical protein